MTTLHRELFLLILVAMLAFAPSMTGAAIAHVDTKLDTHINQTSFWETFFTGLFRAINKADKETPRDDVVPPIERPISIDTSLGDPSSKIPCEFKLQGCQKQRNAVEAKLNATNEELEACAADKDAAESDLAACQSVEDQFDETMARLRDPTPPGDCKGWLTLTAESCNQVCAEKHLQCYGATVRNVNIGAYDVICAPSNCYDETAPACISNDAYSDANGNTYANEDREEDAHDHVLRDCVCCP
ncbi:MAG TPA: hypothetical protein VLJ21_04265 [Candidatus Binatia bacterium]|nr:hypothetical protein [Candidatus Binatia bacterium]